MAELEKVLKGLECCLFKDGFGDCEDCPYRIPGGCDDLLRNALSLLKAQEPAKPVAILTTGSGCSSADCPRCKKRINNWHNPFFCGNCGQAVNWE